MYIWTSIPYVSRSLAMASGYGYDEDFNYDRSHEKSRHDQPQQSKAEAYKKQSSVGNFLKEMQQRAAQIPEE